MIMRGTTRRSLGFGGGLFALTASAVLLPFSPSWAQKADDAKKEPVEVVITKSASTPAVSAGTLSQTYLFQANKAAESQEVFTDVSQPIKEAIERLRAEARKLEKSPVPDGEDALRAKALKRAVGELDRVFCPRVQDMRIEVGQQHLSANLASEAPTTPAAATNAEKLRAEMAELTQLVARRAVDLNEANRRLQEARRKLAESSGRIWDVSRGGVRMAPLPHYPAYQGEIATWLPAPASASGRPEAPNRDGERRLAEVEKKLDRLIKSLEKANEEKSTERQ